MHKILLGLTIAFGTVILNPFAQVSQADARVILREKVKFYNVTGSTGKDIYKSMLNNGPDHSGNRKDVLASTAFKFNFANDAFEIKRNRCVLTNLDIIVDVTYTYPKWVGSRKASKETRTAWKKFEKAAVRHEKEHVKITRKFAKDYERLLKSSRRSASTECAKETAGEKFRASFAIRKHERLHKRFDKRDLGKRGEGFKALLELIRAK